MQDVSRVEIMEGMFYLSPFNQGGISSWNLSSVTTLKLFLNNASDFRHDLCSWGSQLSSRMAPLPDMSNPFRGSNCPRNDPGTPDELNDPWVTVDECFPSLPF